MGNNVTLFSSHLNNTLSREMRVCSIVPGGHDGSRLVVMEHYYVVIKIIKCIVLASDSIHTKN